MMRRDGAQHVGAKGMRGLAGEIAKADHAHHALLVVDDGKASQILAPHDFRSLLQLVIGMTIEDRLDITSGQ